MTIVALSAKSSDGKGARMRHVLGKNCVFWLILLLAFSGWYSNTSANQGNNAALTKTEKTQLTYILPSPKTADSVSVEEALTKRRSYRHFQKRELSAEQLSQILWAAYGITKPVPDRPLLRGGLRTAPSAGALYPFEMYVVVGNVTGIEPGLYKYLSQEHKLVRAIDKDIREALSAAALGQMMVRDAPVTVVYCAVFSRMTQKYGERGRERYVCMDLGHSAQNIYLQAEALHLGTCGVGAFKDSSVSALLQLPTEEEPLYLMPVGYLQSQ
jgi:SagB-type dehydrogenase family enzyme